MLNSPYRIGNLGNQGNLAMAPQVPHGYPYPAYPLTMGRINLPQTELHFHLLEPFSYQHYE